MLNVKIEFNQMQYLFDERLSLKAKGLLALIVAYVNKNPYDKTVFTLADVRRYTYEGSSAFKNAVSELVTMGYMTRAIESNKFEDKQAMWHFTIKE